MCKNRIGFFAYVFLINHEKDLMKTLTYNPSTIEIEFAEAIQSLSGTLQEKIKSNKIISVENKLKEDNPLIIFKLLDKEGDTHEVVLKVIQRADN